MSLHFLCLYFFIHLNKSCFKGILCRSEPILCLPDSLSGTLPEIGTINLNEVNYLREVKTLQSSQTFKTWPSPTNGFNKKNHIETVNKISKRNRWDRIDYLNETNETQVKDPQYQVKINESTCILLVVDAIVGLKYLGSHPEAQVHDIYVPANSKVTGSCKDENEQNLSLRWKTFILTWYFVKKPDKGKWYVSKMELQCDPSDLFFDFINAEGISYILSSNTNDPIIIAPIGKSYTCKKEIKVNLSSPQINMVASVYMRELLASPFMEGEELEQECMCPSTGTSAQQNLPFITITMFICALLSTSKHKR